MFDNIPSHYLIIGTTIMAAFMGTFALFVRLRAQKKPVSAKKFSFHHLRCQQVH